MYLDQRTRRLLAGTLLALLAGGVVLAVVGVIL